MEGGATYALVWKQILMRYVAFTDTREGVLPRYRGKILKHALQ